METANRRLFGLRLVRLAAAKLRNEQLMGSVVFDTVGQLAERIAENIRSLERGGGLLQPVDTAAGY